MTIASLDIVFYTAIFVLPGFIINSIIGYINPPPKSKDSIFLLKCIGYSLISCSVWCWLYLIVIKSDINPVGRWLLLFTISLLGSSLVGFFIAVIKQHQIIDRMLWKIKVRTIHTTPTAWDYIFSKQESGFVIVTLIDDQKLYGWYSAHSFTSSDQDERDIFIEKAYIFDGKKWEIDNQSLGFYIAKDQIKVIEFKKGE